MIEQIKDEIKKILVKAGVTGEIELSMPPNAEMGDFSFACFDSAKKQGKNPKDVAEEIKKKLETGNWKLGIIERVEAVGPYVNFFLKVSEIARLMAKEMKNTKEYGATRNTLVQLYLKSGYKVIPVNYINDFGKHVVMCLWGLKKFHAGEEPKENRQKWLGGIYAEAVAFVKEQGAGNPPKDGSAEEADREQEMTAELDALQKKLESRDPEIWPLFEKTRQWSLDGFDAIHQELGVRHDAVFYESDVKDRGQE